MSEITKTLIDDHARIKRMIGSYKASPTDLDVALAVCEELAIHAAIEEQLVYPELERIDPGMAETSEEEHEVVKDLAAQIGDLEYGDPELAGMMQELIRLVQKHVAKEERDMIPKLRRGLGEKAWDLGPGAFAMRQEMLRGKSPRKAAKMAQLVNTGWSGVVPNAGW